VIYDQIPPKPTLSKLREAARRKPLDTALAQAGIDRTRVYVTNSVKYFKFVTIERGRRLHKKPNAAEIRACHPWLQEEVRLIKPRVIVALRATAAQAMLGRLFRASAAA
jgi:DNA polymerase